MNLGPYRAWLFDCDGVILDSNNVKTNAFYELARPFGVEVADAFVSYHKATGGVSRFVKVRHLFETLLGRVQCEADVAAGLVRFGQLVTDGLQSCAMVPGVEELLDRLTLDVFRGVISGGLESEVQQVLASRGLTSRFDAIRGSPATKDDIFGDLAKEGVLSGGAIFFGDSRYDYEVAERFGVDMVFVSGVSEFEGWGAYFKGRPVRVVEDLVGIVPVEVSLGVD